MNLFQQLNVSATVRTTVFEAATLQSQAECQSAEPCTAPGGSFGEKRMNIIQDDMIGLNSHTLSANWLEMR